MARIKKIRSKLERAKHHILDLDSQFSTFLKDAYTIGTKSKPEISHVQLYIADAKPIPDTFPLLIGDAVHNIRSALDHLVWQLVEATGDIPTNKNSFPIHEEFEKSPK